MQTTAIPKNHMDIPWHEYSGHGNCPITEADLTEKASIVGRVGRCCYPVEREPGVSAVP